MRSNIDSVIEKFKMMADNAANIDFSESLIGGANAARGKMNFRIFNSGKDANGAPFGVYTGKKISKKIPFTPYELKRVSKGRQILKKDLEFYGALRRGIVIVKKDQKMVVCTIVNAQLILIADYQEEQIGKIRKTGKVRIFALSQEERSFFITNTSALLKQQYARAFNP